MQEVSEGRYSGSIINSLGQKGNLTASLDGTTMTASAQWQDGGATEAILQYDAARQTFVGTDTEGCALGVRRPG